MFQNTWDIEMVSPSLEMSNERFSFRRSKNHQDASMLTSLTILPDPPSHSDAHVIAFWQAFKSFHPLTGFPSFPSVARCSGSLLGQPCSLSYAYIIVEHDHYRNLRSPPIPWVPSVRRSYALNNSITLRLGSYGIGEYYVHIPS